MKFFFFNVASMETKVADNHVFKMYSKTGDVFVDIYHALKCRGSDIFASFCLPNVQHFAQKSSYAAITLLEMQLKQRVTRTRDV